MANVGIAPSDDCLTASGTFLTFIVPAPEGCNLACPFCIVRHRQEILDGPALTPLDYTRFIREAAEHHNVRAIAIQGYEPLLPSALAYTRPILRMARQLAIPTSLVTNGVELKAATPLLTALAPTKIAVSLDSPSPVRHDRLRGKSGAWSAAVDGIRHAVSQLPRKTSLAVTSVLMPSGTQGLRGMPCLLAELGVKHWMLSPLVRIGRDGVARFDVVAAKVADILLDLQDKAHAAGIRLTVDDEFDHLNHRRLIDNRPELRRVEFRNLPASLPLFRLLPSGHCSRDADAVNRLREDAPQWNPATEHAGQFLACFFAPGERGYESGRANQSAARQSVRR